MYKKQYCYWLREELRDMLHAISVKLFLYSEEVEEIMSLLPAPPYVCVKQSSRAIPGIFPHIPRNLPEHFQKC